MPKKASQLYFVAIIPPKPVRENIQELKHYVSEKYDSYRSLNAPPHITLLAPFNPQSIDEVSIKIESVCREVDTFDITLENYSSFPPRVIFIDVKKTEQLLNLQKKLEGMARENKQLFKYNYDEREFNPHVTLAFRDLSKKAFHQAWEEFKNQHFHEEFTADHVCLLKHDGKKWNVVQKYKLGFD